MWRLQQDGKLLDSVLLCNDKTFADTRGQRDAATSGARTQQRRSGREYRPPRQYTRGNDSLNRRGMLLSWCQERSLADFSVRFSLWLRCPVQLSLACREEGPREVTPTPTRRAGGSLLPLLPTAQEQGRHGRSPPRWRNSLLWWYVTSSVMKACRCPSRRGGTVPAGCRPEVQAYLRTEAVALHVSAGRAVAAHAAIESTLDCEETRVAVGPRA